MPSPETKQQIDELDLNADQPLLVCDVDEVVFHFIKGLEGYLDTQGFWLDPASYALEGNIRAKSNNRAADSKTVSQIIASFFSRSAHDLMPIAQSVESLAQLSARLQIVMLTNLPHTGRNARKVNLEKHGIFYPLITNEGLKGPAVKYLASDQTSPVFFIDDIPDYLESVAEFCPSVFLIHFMQDKRFAVHARKVAREHFLIDNWPDVVSYINTTIDANQ